MSGATAMDQRPLLLGAEGGGLAGVVGAPFSRRPALSPAAMMSNAPAASAPFVMTFIVPSITGAQHRGRWEEARRVTDGIEPLT